MNFAEALAEGRSKAQAASLVKDVAAEGEVAGSKGYRAAQQYTYAMSTLWEANFLEGAAPLLGADSEDVLREFLGLDEQTIGRLKRDRVIG